MNYNTMKYKLNLHKLHKMIQEKISLKDQENCSIHLVGRQVKKVKIHDMTNNLFEELCSSIFS